MRDEGSRQLTRQELINQLARTRRHKRRISGMPKFKDQKVDVRGVDDRRHMKAERTRWIQRKYAQAKRSRN